MVETEKGKEMRLLLTMAFDGSERITLEERHSNMGIIR